jgi:hypothetical protein
MSSTGPTMEDSPIVEQTWLRARATTPGEAVVVEGPCGCRYWAGWVPLAAPLPLAWVRLQVLQVMPNGDLVVKDDEGGQSFLTDLAVERLCPRHKRDQTD